MADSHQENIEQGEAVKKWLKENGMSIVLGIGLGLAAIFGYRTWGNYQINQKLDAAAQYQAVAESVTAGDLEGARGYAAVLSSEHAESPYTTMAQLSVAAAALEADNLETAQEMLKTAMSTGKPEVMRHLARARLARVLLAAGDAQAAADTVAQPPAGFEAIYAEIRGDALVAAGQLEQAYTAYQEALDNMEANAGNRYLLELKQGDLGVSES